MGCSTFTHGAKPATRKVADGERMNPQGRVARTRQYRGDDEHQGDEHLENGHAGARAPVPPVYGSGRPAFSPPTVLRGRGRIFPAPARGNPAPHGWRAISVPLTAVSSGLLRSLPDTSLCRSSYIEAQTVQLPKLTVRVRFPSPAPTKKAPGRNWLFGLRQLLRGVNARPYPLRSAPMMWRSRFSSSSSVGELE